MKNPLFGSVRLALTCGAMVAVTAALPFAAQAEVEPVAVWDMDFRSSPAGFSMDLAGNSLVDRGKAVQIGNESTCGVRFETGNLYPLTVLVKYSGLTVPGSDSLLICGRCPYTSLDLLYQNRVGVMLTSQSKTVGFWRNAKWVNSGAFTSTYPVSTGSGKFALRYDSRKVAKTGRPTSADRGTFLFANSGSGWATNYYATGLLAESSYTDAIAIGGTCYDSSASGASPLTGLKIHSVAVFNTALDMEDLEQFEFESDKVPLTAEIPAGGTFASWAALPWASAWANDAARFTCVSNGTDVATSVTLAENPVCRSVAFIGGGSLYIDGGEHAVSARAFDASGMVGRLTLDFDTASADVDAGTDTVLMKSGSGELFIDGGMKATVSNGWSGAILGGGRLVKAGSGDFEPGSCSGFTGTWEVAEGSLTLAAGSEGTVVVDAGATLRLRLSAVQMSAGYTAGGVSLASSTAHLVFVTPSGGEVDGDSGTYVPSKNRWSTTAASGNWSTGALWSKGEKPGAGDDVEIVLDGDVTLVMDEASAALNSVTLMGSGRLTVTGGKLTSVIVTSDVSMDCAEGSLQASSVSLKDGVTLAIRPSEGERLVFDGGVQGGTVDVAGMGSVIVSNSAGFAVSGTCVRVESGTFGLCGSGMSDVAIELWDGATLAAEGSLTSAGTLSISNGTAATVFAGGTAISGEALVKAGAGELRFACGADFSSSVAINGGTLGFAADATLSGAVSGAGGIHAVTGTVALTGSATYAGGTVIEKDGAAATVVGRFGSGSFHGSGTAEFRTVMPVDASVDVLTNATLWKGTCWLRNIEEEQKNVNPGSYANSDSRIKLTGYTGYVPQGSKHRCNSEVELSPDGLTGITTAFNISAGYSQSEFTFAKVTGSGTIDDALDSAGAHHAYRILDGSEFRGSVFTKSKRIIFGSDAKPSGPGIWVSSDATITLPYASRLAYRSRHDYAVGIVIAGHLRVEHPNQITISYEGMPKVLQEGGVLEFVTYFPYGERPYAGEWNADYSDWTGDGAVKFSGVGHRILPEFAYKLPNRSLAFIAEQDEGVLFGEGEGATNCVGSLCGSGMMRTDSHNGNRCVSAYQRKNTEWSGVFGGTSDRLKALLVDGDPEAAGRTLTLSGNNVLHKNELEVLPNGSVNLTGTWWGDVTVAGSFGGTGTVTNGIVTFASGAVLDATRGTSELPSLGAWPAAITVNVPASLIGSHTAAKVIDCDTIPSLDVVAVSFTVDGESSRKRFELLAVQGDGLYVRYLPYGMRVILR